MGHSGIKPPLKTSPLSHFEIFFSFFSNMCLVLSVAWNVCGRCHGDTRRIPPSKREQIQLMRGHTHNLTQYTRSHSKWWHGNTTVNPDWGPSAGLTSLRPPQKKQACWSLQHHSGSHCRLLRDVAGYSKFTFLFASPAFFKKKFLTLHVSVSVSVYVKKWACGAAR